jgi:hypothetical protein
MMPPSDSTNPAHVAVFEGWGRPFLLLDRRRVFDELHDAEEMPMGMILGRTTARGARFVVVVAVFLGSVGSGLMFALLGARTVLLQISPLDRIYQRLAPTFAAE